MSDKPAVWNFIRAFRPIWFAAMSGGFSVPIAFAAALLDNKYVQGALLAMAFGSAWFASYQGERQEVYELETRLDGLINECTHSLQLIRADYEDYEDRRQRDKETKVIARQMRFMIRCINRGKVYP